MSLHALAVRQLFARASTLLGGGGVALAASFVQTILVARMLGPGYFGVWASLQAFCTVVATFLTFRTSEPVTRYLTEYAAQTSDQGRRSPLVALLLGTAIAVDAITQSLAVIMVALLAPWVAPLLPGGEAVAVLYPLLAISLLRTVFDATWFSVARHLAQYRTIAALNAFFPVLRLMVLAIAWVLYPISLATIVVLMMVLGILQMFVIGWSLWQAISTGYGLGLSDLFTARILHDQRKLASFWSFMKATFLGSLFSALVKEGDVLILGSLRPSEEVGWYRLAKSLAGTVQQIGELLAQVIYQDFSEHVVARDGALLRNTLRFLFRTWLPAVVVAILVGIALAYFCIPILFGRSYAPTVGLFSILMVGTGCVTALFWVRPLILALELYWYNFQVVAWGAGCFLLLDWVLIQRFCVDGAAIALATLTMAGPLVLLPKVLERLKRM